jgi:hypothetical protein
MDLANPEKDPGMTDDMAQCGFGVAHPTNEKAKPNLSERELILDNSRLRLPAYTARTFGEVSVSHR